MSTVEMINLIIMCVFLLCYSYQFVYIPIGLLTQRKYSYLESRGKRVAVLIAARNEQAVIGELIDSIRAQDYPQQLIDIIVGADNCTDRTAETARGRGARVFERQDTEHVGKGYVLNFLLYRLQTLGLSYDAYIVLDADNILDPGFIAAMCGCAERGHDIVTCYRNSKNYGDNWLSAGIGLWFLRESRYLNGARAAVGSSCAVSGTGFLFTRRILERCGGWRFFLLTEDIEFTIDNVTGGVKIGYCPDAITYDEQPVTFRQSWRQRMRWSKGYLQVFRKYAARDAARQLFVLRHGYEHHAGSYTHRPEHRREYRRGDSESRFRRRLGRARHGGLAARCRAVPHTVCRRRDNHAFGVEKYPLHRGKKGALRLHLPPVHADLRSDLHRGDVQKSGLAADPAHAHARRPFTGAQTLHRYG